MIKNQIQKNYNGKDFNVFYRSLSQIPNITVRIYANTTEKFYGK